MNKSEFVSHMAKQHKCTQAETGNAVVLDGVKDLVIGGNLAIGGMVIGGNANKDVSTLTGGLELKAGSLIIDGDVGIHIPTITIQPGFNLTIKSTIEGPMDIIYGDHTMHIEEVNSLSNCTIEMVGDTLDITPL